MPVRLSLLGGLMLLSMTRTTTTSTFSARGSYDTESTDKEAKALAFAGLSATAKLSDQFGLVGYAKVTTDPNYSQIGLSAAWLF